MVDKIISLLNIDGVQLEIQRIQTAHRLKLIDFWGINEGSRILEIGCGQGDTTVALACVTGERGFVCATDIAQPEYGAPETLGQARERILASEIGGRVRMHFGFDIARQALPADESGTDRNKFDFAVLSHSLWYMSSFDELVGILTEAGKYADRLCIAEWNPEAKLAEQLPHYKAATIQAVCGCFSDSEMSNIRTMFYPRDIKKALAASGWRAENEGSIYSPDMQDGQWEVSAVTEYYPSNSDLDSDAFAAMPKKLKDLILSQIAELKRVKNVRPLPVYCATASKM